MWGNNNYSGDIKSVTNCTKLQTWYLTLSPNVTGDIIAFANKPKLYQAIMYGTDVYGDISVFSNYADTCYGIWVRYTQVSGSVNSLVNLTNLTELYVNITNLESLGLWSNSGLYGDISTFKNLTNLKSINIYGAAYTGDMSVFANMPNLEVLNMGAQSGVYGSINSLSNLTRIYWVSILNSSSISGDISIFANMLNMSCIALSDTQVSGSINGLTNLNSLHTLSVNKSRSTLTGTSEQTWNIFVYNILIAIIAIQIYMVILDRFLTYLN